MKKNNTEWSRGYYCAVAILLREAGCVTPDVRALFDQGGGAEHADATDIELFRQHDLLPALPALTHADVSDERVMSFHSGQVWMSPRGTLYRVDAVERGGKAVLKTGFYGQGRSMTRDWDGVLGGWTLVSDTGVKAPVMLTESPPCAAFAAPLAAQETRHG